MEVVDLMFLIGLAVGLFFGFILGCEVGGMEDLP